MPRVLAVFVLKVIETFPVFGGWIVHGLHALLVLCIPHSQLGRVLETNMAVYDQPRFLETDGSSSAGLCFDAGSIYLSWWFAFTHSSITWIQPS